MEGCIRLFCVLLHGREGSWFRKHSCDSQVGDLQAEDPKYPNVEYLWSRTYGIRALGPLGTV